MTRRPVKGNRPDGAFMLVARGLGRALSALTRSYERARGWLEASFQVGALPALPLVLLAILVAIIPLAYASPTDPTWIAGIYDAADYDDVLDVLTDSNAVRDFGSTIAVQPTVAAQPLSTVVPRLVPSFGTLSDIGILLAFFLRSPPNRLHRKFGRYLREVRIWQRPAQGRPDGAFVFLVTTTREALRVTRRRAEGVRVASSPTPEVSNEDCFRRSFGFGP